MVEINVSLLGDFEKLLAMGKRQRSQRSVFADVPSSVRSVVISGRATR